MVPTTNKPKDLGDYEDILLWIKWEYDGKTYGTCSTGIYDGELFCDDGNFITDDPSAKNVEITHYAYINKP